MRRMSVLFAISVALILPATPAADGAGLFRAIRNGDVALIEAHLTKPENEVRAGRGATPLVHAVAFGRKRSLCTIAAGGCTTARDVIGRAGLRFASRDWNASMMAALPLTAQTAETKPLFHAIRQGNHAEVEPEAGKSNAID